MDSALIYEKADARIKISTKYIITYYCWTESNTLNRLMILRKEGLGGCSFKRACLSAATINADLWKLLGDINSSFLTACLVTLC